MVKAVIKPEAPIEIKEGDLWESKNKVYKREVLVITTDGGIVTQDRCSQYRMYWTSEMITKQCFYRRLSTAGRKE